MEIKKCLFFNEILSKDRSKSWEFIEKSYLFDDNDKPLAGEDVNKLISNNAKDYKLEKDDILYLYPGCSIPRIKLKSFKEDNDITTTIKQDKANKTIASNSSGFNFFDYRQWNITPRVIVKTDDFINFLKKEFSEDDLLAFNFDDMLEKYPSILIGYYAEMIIEKDHSSYANIMNTSYSDRMDYMPVKEGLENKLEFLINNLDKIYNQESLIKLVNSSSEKIDDDMYKMIQELFESPDKANHEMAMELIANCNYEESINNLYKLFYKYAYQMSCCKNKNHVNFKSLLKYLRLTFNSRLDFDNTLRNISKLRQLTKTDVQEFLNFYKKENMSYIYNSDLLTVSQVKFTEKLNILLEPEKELENV